MANERLRLCRYASFAPVSLETYRAVVLAQQAQPEITALAEDPARLGARPNMSMAPDEVLSSLSVRPISAPNPVAGADGRVHLALDRKSVV